MALGMTGLVLGRGQGKVGSIASAVASGRDVVSPRDKQLHVSSEH